MHLHRESQEELPAMSRMQLQAGLKYGESPLLGPFSGWGVREKFTWVSGDFRLHIGLLCIAPRGSSSKNTQLCIL